MSDLNKTLQRFKPAVAQKWLVLLSGLMWSGVGILLISLAAGWLLPLTGWQPFFLAGLGLAAALVIFRFGFLRLAQKNVHRIDRYPDKVCLFAFQEWKSYLIVVVMMTMGITLRHSSFPKSYLAVLYAGIGGGLFFSSLHYYQQLFKSG
ncbi:MAG: hypothetical protein ACK2T7_12855 [Anaerolineales bacterium]|jgi:fucose 4-O-acetylase-like acetyltransferase